MKPTNKQLQKLAEWLPQDQKINGYTKLCHFSHDEARYVHDAAWSTLRKWFLSNDGQAAIMDELGQSNIQFIHYIYDKPFTVKLGFIKWGELLEIFIVEAKTRQEALIMAVSEMLEE